MIIRGRIAKSFGKLLYIKLAQVQYTGGLIKERTGKAIFDLLYYIISYNSIIVKQNINLHKKRGIN